MKKLVASMLLLAVAGCAVNQSVRRDDVRGVVPPAPPDKALVVFARPTLLGRGFNTRVYDGETLAGLVQGKSYFTYEAAPGKHLFAAKGHEFKYTNYAFLEADLSPGKTYYVYVSMYVRYVGAGLQFWVDLKPIKPGSEDWTKMQTWLPGECVKLEMLPSARQVEAENAAAFGTLRQKFFATWSTENAKARIDPPDGV